MKALAKVFNTISAFYRLVVTLCFFILVFFSSLVDQKLLFAFFDLAGIRTSSGILKPICIILAILLFIINIRITRRIFRGRENGQGQVGNLIISLVLMALLGLVYLSYRERFLIYLLAMNGLLFLGAVFSLIAKGQGAYDSEDEEEEIPDEKFGAKEVEEAEVVGSGEDLEEISLASSDGVEGKKVSPTGPTGYEGDSIEENSENLKESEEETEEIPEIIAVDEKSPSEDEEEGDEEEDLEISEEEEK